ncbi:MAG: ABC-2 transporter permease [Clostridia bacterium]|nr:ABC-2 transporter permease [Clostridia bacterium]
MKGTLIKELYALKSSRMIALIIVYAVVILLSILVSTPWFSLILFVLSFTAPLTYASNDERHGWKNIVKALPVSTAKRVAARYIICCAELLLATVVASVLNIVPGNKFLANAVNETVILFFIGALGMASVLLVSNIPQRGLRIPMGILAVITFSEWVFLLFMDTAYWVVGIKAILAFEKWMIAVVLLAGVAVMFISYLLTVHFSTQKLERKPKMKKSIAATAICLGVAACLSTAVLGVKGRLVPEPMMDIDTFVEYKDEFGSILLYNVRKTSNQQNLSKIEMNEAIRKLAGKEVCGDDIEQRRAVLEQAGFKVWISDEFLAGYDDLEFSSKYGTLAGYSYSDSFSIYSDCPAKYVAVTDKKEMVFDDDDFASGISEAEFINLLEEKDMPVREFYEDAYYYGSVYRTYTVYIAYEIIGTNEIFIDNVTFKVQDGKLCNYTVSAVGSYDDIEYFPPDDDDINESREYMMEYARALSGKTVAGIDINTCRDKLEEIGAQPIERTVFENYVLGENHLEISFNEASAYPGKVNFIKASGETGAKHYTSLTEGELAAIERKFSVGMSDEKLVELLEKEGFYPASINENIDYGYIPEKVYKCYSLMLEIDSYDNYDEQYYESCEIRVELYDGVVTNTIVYLDGYTELNDTEQYTELEKMWEYMSARTQSAKPLAELVDEFEKMSSKTLMSVEADMDDVLFETYEWQGEYYFSLARQIPTGYNDEFYQLFMDVRYIYNESEYKGIDESEWGDSGDAKFFDGVRKSPAYNALKDAPIVAVDVYISET